MISFDFTSLEGTVIERINRFVVSVEYNGSRIDCHLHDPGRLRELIFPGNHVLFRKTSGIRTDHSITAARKDQDWILTDSRFHNTIGGKFLSCNARSEVQLGKSRIDFLDRGCYVEVKGCSLEEEHIAKFPDAPSVRATKHLRELMKAREHGVEGMIMFLIFSPKAERFMPNSTTDPEFSASFYNAMRGGVMTLALKFETTIAGIRFLGEIPINREEPTSNSC